MNRLIDSVKKAFKSLLNSVPVLVGVILLVSLVSSIIPKSLYTSLFTGNIILDPFIGAIIGSILAGNPITSYILGGEFLLQGISMLAITSFLVSWVTVGLVQMPAESMLLGKKFAVTRNITAFFFAIIVAVLTVIGVNLL